MTLIDGDRLLVALEELRANPTEDAVMELMDRVTGFVSPHADLRIKARPAAPSFARPVMTNAIAGPATGRGVR